jgi:6-pyruvoyltetrahydropterin/6-carboxytetrahydropterin synthase
VVDFSEIKKAVNAFDHRDLNEILPQPTAENLARAICEAVPKCVMVQVRESEGNTACYMK